jgi:hypothetical protein
MAAGDYVTNYASIANGSYTTIQPGAGVVWMIQNLQTGGAWELYRYDGSDYTLVMDGSIAEVIDKLQIISDNDYYYKLKNVSGGSVFQGYAGVVLK